MTVSLYEGTFGNNSRLGEGGRQRVGGLSKCPHHYCSLIVEVEQRGPNYLKGISVALTPNNKWFRDFPLQPRFVSLTKSSAQHESLMRTTTSTSVQAALLKHQFPAKAIGGFNEKRVFNKTMTLDLCPIVADMLNEICWTLFKLENLKTIIFIRAMGMRRAWFCLSIECLRDAFVRIQGLNAKLPSEQPQDLILLQLS